MAAGGLLRLGVVLNMAAVVTGCGESPNQRELGDDIPVVGSHGETYPSAAAQAEEGPPTDDLAEDSELVEDGDPHTLLATLRLSHTHRVEFWEWEPGVQHVREEFHVDEDRDSTTAVSLRAGSDELPSLLETYRGLSAGRTDSAIEQILSVADERRTLADTGAALPAFPAALEGNLLQDLSVPRAIPKSHAVCPAPSGWDWTADSLWWFQEQGCYGLTWRHRCIATDPSLHLEDGPRTVQVYGVAALAQQFCNRMRFTVIRYSTGGWYNSHTAVLQEVLEPRHFMYAEWSTTKYPLLKMSSYVQKVSGSQPDKKAIAVRWWHPDYW